MQQIKRDDEKKLDKIKSEITKFDLAIPGTIRKIFLQCGKAGCAFKKEKLARHGPYYLWDRKVGKKLSSMSIDTNDLPLIKRWIGNRKKLEVQTLELFALSQTVASALIELKREGRKKAKSPIPKM